MTDQSSGGPAGVAPELAQRNSVEIFLNTVEGAIRATKTFGENPNHKSLENIFKNLNNALKKCFIEGEDSMDLEVRGAQIYFQKRKIYENKDKKKSLALMFQESGIRVVRFKESYTQEDLKEFLKLLRTDFSAPEHVDEDLYCLFKEMEMESFEVFSDDVLKERQKQDPDFRESSKKFIESIQVKNIDKRPPEPRRLRKDDLKIIEEFQLSPAQFSRSDEEVSRIVKNIVPMEGATGKEKAAIERLALMGFHFLLQDGENEQVQVGRDLLQQVCQMSLEQGRVPLFSALVRKVLQLHRDKENRRGEFQKILDFIFSVDRAESFHDLLADPDHQREIVKLLLSAPPSAVKLVVCLLSAQVWMPKTFSNFVLENIHDHSAWLDQEVEKNPESSNWEHLINILSKSSNPQLLQFIEKLFDSSGDSMRAKLLKQCAEIGTNDSLKFFAKQLRSEDPADRELVYTYLPYSKSKTGANIVLSFIQSERFEDIHRSEKEKAYATYIQLAGKDAKHFLLEEWLREGSGFFKSKSQNERRSLLLRSILVSEPGWIEPLLEKTPLETLHEDLRKLAERALSKRNGGSK